MPWFIVQPGRMPIGDQQPFPTREDAATVAARRYPETDCHLISANTIGDALREVIDQGHHAPGPAAGTISPRLRADHEPPVERAP